jgi:serine/threonine-protein kinase
MVAAGRVIADKYELVEPIAEGGMARIWRARHTTQGHELAIKLVGPSLAEDAQWRKRFVREARLLARLGQSSEHVVHIVDYGVFDDRPYLAMELLEGRTLADHLDRLGRLPAAETVRIVGQLCKALKTVHAAGVVHRDVKPANVFLHRREHDGAVIVKLLDFGVAKLRVDSDLTVPTRAGTLLGTPHYMSPEQFLGETTIDERADLWAVGVVAYRMLVGRAPFSVGPAAELGARILGQEPPPPSALVPSLPVELDAFFKRALAKRAKDRFADAASLSVALAQALASAAQEPAPVSRGAHRHAKGVNLIDLVKLLRIARREGKLEGLDADDTALLDERVLVSSWYPIERFWRVLALAHERVLGGSERATVQLGRAGAEQVVAAGVHSVFLSGNDFDRVLRGFARGWSSYFDFGSVEIARDGDLVRVTISGYPDIPRAHALTTLGWYERSLQLTGAEVRSAKITAEPWSGAEAAVFEYEIAFQR